MWWKKFEKLWKKRKKGKDFSLRYSRRGALSCKIAMGVWGTFLLLLVIAILVQGKAIALLGSIGMITMLFSVMGVVLGIRGLKEIGKDYKNCLVGIFGNAGAFFLFFLLFIRGLTA